MLPYVLPHSPSGHTPAPRGTMRLQGTGTDSSGGILSLVGHLPNPRVCWGLAVTLHPFPSPPPQVLGPEIFGSFFSVRILDRSEPLPALPLLSVGHGCWTGGEDGDGTMEEVGPQGAGSPAPPIRRWMLLPFSSLAQVTLELPTAILECSLVRPAPSHEMPGCPERPRDRRRSPREAPADRRHPWQTIPPG